jgi:hypothetical protein
MLLLFPGECPIEIATWHEPRESRSPGGMFFDM